MGDNKGSLSLIELMRRMMEPDEETLMERIRQHDPSTVRVTPAKTQDERCAVCRDGPEGLVICRGCNTLMHASCLIGVRGCPTIGCNERDPLQEEPSDHVPAGISAREHFGASLEPDDPKGEVYYGKSPGEIEDELEAERQAKLDRSGKQLREMLEFVVGDEAPHGRHHEPGTPAHGQPLPKPLAVNKYWRETRDAQRGGRAEELRDLNARLEAANDQREVWRQTGRHKKAKRELMFAILCIFAGILAAIFRS